MPDIHLSVDIERPPEAVFDLLADIAHYHRWLPPSKTYSETVEISDSPIKQGTTYVDRNSTNVLYGEVIEYQPPTRIVFHQASEKPGLDVTIRYVLTPTASGTHLERTTTIRTARLLRLLQRLVVQRIREENGRTLAALKAHLEAQAP
ncbi:MAG: SRPBCC family protein [Anaerolineae bacterium]